MTWKEFTYKLVCDYCNKNGKRTFSLQAFFSENEALFFNFKPTNSNILPKVRQQLQFLRDEGALTFEDNRGNYTLRGVDILEDEIDETNIHDVNRAAPEKREYLIETFARNKGWVEEAKVKFGLYCMLPKCNNTFIREDGAPYIEVHHIVPLHMGGEDGVWNLSVVCAHHHKMAHFAAAETKLALQQYLFKEVSHRLAQYIKGSQYEHHRS
jgi:predicted HNH restriction endonuclease